MSHTYLKGTLSTKKTPQSEPIPGSGQVENTAGGFLKGLEIEDGLLLETAIDEHSDIKVTIDYGLNLLGSSAFGELSNKQTVEFRVL